MTQHVVRQAGADLVAPSVWKPATVPLVDTLDAAAAAATRWVRLGRDVVIRADRGAGRTTCLRAVASAVGTHGYTSVIVDHHHLDPARGWAPGGPRGGRAPQDAAHQIVGDLGSRGVLLLDDLHDLTEPALELLRSILTHSSARLVATASGELVADGRPPALAKILSGRGPAEVELAPLDYAALAQLVADRLDGPADATVVSSVLELSAGNLTTALAVVDAARFARVVRKERGTWSLVGDLDDLPMSSVAHLLVPDLQADALQALQWLARYGPVRAAEVPAEVPEAVLAELLGRRHVVRQHVGPGAAGDLLAVSPPALARALDGRGTGAGAPGAGEHPRPAGAVGRRVGDPVSVAPRAADARWAAQATSFLHAHAREAEAASRAAWEADPSVRTALPYLVRLLRRPACREVRRVFDSTPVAAEADRGRLAMFRLLRHRWSLWQPADGAVSDEPVPEGSDLNAEITALVLEAAREDWPDRPLLDRLESVAGACEQPWSGELRLRAAGSLVAAGRYSAAVALADAAGPVPEWMPAEYDHYLEGVRTTALLLSGRVTEAVASARSRLEAAYDDHDLTGIRVHGKTLAHALALAGHPALAWNVVNAVLRLGAPGPLGNSFHRRSLMLGAVLSTRQGVVEVAQQLLHELSRTPVGYRPVLGTRGVLAQAALLRVEGRGAEADDLLWREGAREVAAGWTSSGSDSWAFRSCVPTPDEAAQISALRARVPGSVYDPLLALQVALVDPRVEELESAIRRAPLHMAVELAATALTTLSAARVSVGDRPVATDELAGLVGPTVAGWLRQGPASWGAVAELSRRELEVARLVAAGRTNRDIAEQLHVSRRTVENHVYRALQKLGLSSRHDLGQALVVPR